MTRASHLLVSTSKSPGTMVNVTSYQGQVIHAEGHRSCPTKHSLAQSSSVRRKVRTAACTEAQCPDWGPAKGLTKEKLGETKVYYGLLRILRILRLILRKN